MDAVANAGTLQKHGERIAALENNQQHLATKADIANLQATLTWRLIIAVSVATAILGILIQSP